jgi:predicted lysophospholipase L1 biosynthesis ABC-type transport system permease subunit
MGMTVAEGRTFTAEDRAGAPMVVVVNRAFVKRYFSDGSPLRAHISLQGDTATIVGIVDDVHHAGPAVAPDAELYVPCTQLASRMGWLVLRTAGDPAAVAPALRQAMRDVGPNLPLASVRPMATLVATSVAQPRFLATLLTSFSGVAAGLALVGIYGLLEFSVSRRTREIGVRMALGASRRSVVLLVIRQSLVVVMMGVVIGAAAGATLSRIGQSLLFGVAPGDPATVAGMAGLVMLAALLASYLPAQRAAGVDPVLALRNE